MNTDITEDPKVTEAVTEDKNLADAILDGYDQGSFDKEFALFSNDELRRKINVQEEFTFRTQKADAFITIMNKELAKRAGHPNEIRDYQREGLELLDEKIIVELPIGFGKTKSEN